MAGVHGKQETALPVIVGLGGNTIVQGFALAREDERRINGFL